MPLSTKVSLFTMLPINLYVVEPDVPRSIYEIKGARKVAIEIRSYSKPLVSRGSARFSVLSGAHGVLANGRKSSVYKAVEPTQCQLHQWGFVYCSAWSRSHLFT